jgi:hypothetical protein
MAVLSGKSTGGILSWDKYVKNNSKWKDLILKIENKETAVFLKDDKKNTHKMLSESTEMKLLSNQKILISGKPFAKVKVGALSGYVPLNKIRKPTKTNVLEAEEAAMADLNKLIQKLITQVGPIDICTPLGTYKSVTGVRNVTEKILGRDVKADFVIVSGKKDLIYISHKKLGGPEAYQQYGGLSEKSGTTTNPLLIYNDPEVVKFMSKVTTYIEDNRLTNPVYSYVDSETLINRSIFGPSYGKAYGVDNVHMIAQGNPVLTPDRNKENCYNLTWTSHYSFNGDLSHFKSSGYRPAFAATYRAGRGFTLGGVRYNGARLGIYPIALVINRSGATEI